MKVLCIAVFALLSLTDIAAAARVLGGECTRQKENVVDGLLGAFIPDCDMRGNFKPVQCHGSVCYCVDRINGDRKDGTDVGRGEGRPDCDGPCTKERKSLRGNSLRGADRPDCDIDGNYKRMQCHASTGYCWCADSVTGAKVTGSDVAPGNPKPQCGGVCTMRLRRARLMVGYHPTCDSEGNFEKRQCSGSSGYCWCADTMTGKKVAGTAARPWENEVVCE